MGAFFVINGFFRLAHFSHPAMYDLTLFFKPANSIAAEFCSEF